MNAIVPSSQLYRWAALCLSARCLRLSSRRYSVAKPFVVDPERARLLTSFYYQGAIDKAANKVGFLQMLFYLFVQTGCMQRIDIDSNYDVVIIA